MLEFEKIWEMIEEKNKRYAYDEEYRQLLHEVYRSALKYVGMRVEWNWMTLEQKQEKDSLRTSFHDGFMTNYNVLGRYVSKILKDSLPELPEDRKDAGDFACYICYRLGIDAR